jgi:outer membrane receptor protein involved in Fe transport
MAADGAAQSNQAEAAQPQAAQSPQAEAEVVVTASKRPEIVQNVASSVGVLTGRQLVVQHLTQLTDYATQLPGLNIVNGGAPGAATIEVRGIASLGEGALVGTYLDETPVGSSGGWNYAASTALDLPPYDLQRIELLRGPQGTLYGASTMGGLLKYVLQSPSTTQFEARAGADVITVDGASGVGSTFRGMVNIPVVQDLFAVRLSADDATTPGYTNNAYTGVRHGNGYDESTIHLSALWTPTSTLSVKFNAFWHNSHSNDLDDETYKDVTAVPNANGANIVTANHSLGDLTQSHAFAQPFTRSLDLYSATVDWSPGPVEFISATSWSHSTARVVDDESTAYGAYFPLLTGGAVAPGLVRGDNQALLDKFTQEFRVVSPENKPVEWLAGLYYTDETSRLIELGSAYDNNYQPIPAFSPYILNAVVPTTYKEWAVFGDVTWHVTDRFDLTAGGRYSGNDQQFHLTASGALTGSLSEPGGSSETVGTYMTAARYHFTKDIMAYARVATGYRPGGPNSPGAGIPPSYGSDTLINYEAGVKSEFLDHKALIDASVFYINWDKIQLIESNGLYTYYGNGGKAVTEGVEWTSSYSPVASLDLGFNTAYTKADLTSVSAAANYLLIGYQLAGVPQWTVALTASYDWTLADDWRAHVGGDWHWVDEEWSSTVQRFTAASVTPSILLPAYSAVDLDASLTKGKVTFKLFASNVGNTRAFQGATVNTAFGVPQSVDFAILQPRTIGAGVDVAF